MKMKLLLVIACSGFLGKVVEAGPICNLKELGEVDYRKCMCNSNRQKYSHLLDVEIQVDCANCLKEHNVYLVRGARLECVPCVKFDHPDNSSRFFTLHFIADARFCPLHFVPANYRQADVGCGARGESEIILPIFLVRLIANKIQFIIYF